MSYNIYWSDKMDNIDYDSLIPDIEKTKLKKIKNDIYLSDAWIEILERYDIDYRKYNSVSALIFDIEDKVIFLCHGDKYNVKYGLDEIEAKAKSIDADIVIFGHTHTPLNFKKDNIIYLNPGSVSLPRGVDYKSFSIMNLENDNIKIEQIRL